MLITWKAGILDPDSQYWDSTSKKIPLGQDYDRLIAEHYRRAHFNLINRWTRGKSYHAVLKTDLFAEAMCPSRSFAWDVLKLYGKLTGIDISGDICRKAKGVAIHHALTDSLEVATCDVRKLPFAAGSFDLVISDSTLDHYKSKGEIDNALKELARVLKPGGTLIITLDNKSNITEPLFRLWLALGLSPFYIGKTYSMAELEKVLVKTGMSVTGKTTLIHNPRFFAKFITGILRKINPGKADGRIKRLLNYFDSLENKKTKYLTAQFIAIKATKPISS
jgi:ubiquinone/menaquinone biosynthesis C-methylase UbiE